MHVWAPWWVFCGVQCCSGCHCNLSKCCFLFLILFKKRKKTKPTCIWDVECRTVFVPHWWEDMLAWKTEALHVSVCKSLPYNAHLLVMAMDYCIVFCLWSALIAFLLLYALCNVICPYGLRRPFSWAFPQLLNRYSGSCSDCQHGTFSIWNNSMR